MPFRLSEAEVKALNKHEEVLPELTNEVSERLGEATESQLDPEALNEWIDARKPKLKEAETDVRDARKRIQNAKGPSKKAKPEQALGDQSSESDGGASGED